MFMEHSAGRHGLFVMSDISIPSNALEVCLPVTGCADSVEPPEMLAAKLLRFGLTSKLGSNNESAFDQTVDGPIGHEFLVLAVEACRICAVIADVLADKNLAAESIQITLPTDIAAGNAAAHHMPHLVEVVAQEQFEQRHPI